ncbi:MAG: SAM-dependent chlorinase/fluorinase, partial [Dehalococcoidia bacterium]|nr:SAM-dependent chlorinase/fluorinase [Dehalococcoidia bacterium]
MTTIITLTTDFGTEDPYVGIMKGVVLGINPQARLVDLTHAVGPQQVLQGSFLLGTAFRYFPPGTVHLAVVDPGVGSARRALALQAGDYSFVAPDN